MHRFILLLFILGTMLTAGCAALGMDTGQSASAQSDGKDYVTGSRIAVKDKSMIPPDTDKNTINTIYQRAQVCTGGGACGGGN